MSVINLGLQGVALARDELVGGQFEKEFKKCNGLGAVRLVAKGHEKNIVEPTEVDALNDEEREGEVEQLSTNTKRMRNCCCWCGERKIIPMF